MTEPDDPRNLDRLGDRIARARKGAGLDERPDEDSLARGRQMSYGWRIAIELVTSVVVCAGIGWAADRWFGTAPWGMLVMLFLGFAAGANNAVRLARRMSRPVAAEPGPKGPDRTKG